jgi:hypothetical protein
VWQGTTPSRRLTSRVEVSDGAWVYWRCNGSEELSRIRNLSIGGLFIETSKTRPVGIRTNLDFLVQEGQIRAEAVVRHAKTSRGLGLKFTAVSEPDRPNLAALMSRLRGLSRPHGNLRS